jgi:hypothetical protein
MLPLSSRLALTCAVTRGSRRSAGSAPIPRGSKRVMTPACPPRQRSSSPVLTWPGSGFGVRG